MKRRNGLIFAVIGILLTGCFNKDISNQKESVETDKSMIKHLSVIDQGQLNCSSEEGYYYVAKDGFKTSDGNFAYNMMYMDYSSQQEIYLCNRPGCKHKTLDCPSVFSEDEVQIGSSLFFLNDYLYLFSHAPDQDGVSIQNNHSEGILNGSNQPLDVKPAVIYQMKADGTERKKVIEFESNEFVENTVLSDGDYLFVFTKKLSSESSKNTSTQISATDRQLVQINLKDWRMNKAVDLETDLKVIGSTNDKIVFSKIDYGKKIDTNDYTNDEYLAIYKDSSTDIVVLDINNGKTEGLISLPNSSLNTFAVGNGNLYYSSEGTQKIHAIDLDSKENSIFKETSANAIDGIYDDVLLCSKWDAVNSNHNDISMHFIHFNDKKEDISHLKQSVMGNNIIIKNELEDSFLVVYDYDAQIDTQYDNGQYSINGLKYGLISKNDLYSGKANYKKINMIGFGE